MQTRNLISTYKSHPNSSIQTFRQELTNLCPSPIARYSIHVRTNLNLKRKILIRDVVFIKRENLNSKFLIESEMSVCL
jgi:hypothetical protein